MAGILWGSFNGFPPNNNFVPSSSSTASMCALIFSLFHERIGATERSFKVLFPA
jgi:hypothetical protein